MTKRIKVAILEDQADIAANLCSMVNEDPELTLMAAYSSSEEALQERLTEKAIDVFLVDLGLPGLDGINFIATAKTLLPQTYFLVHTISEAGEKLWSALAAGAIGYVLKGSHAGEITQGIKIVARGNTLISPRMAAKLIRFFNEIQSPLHPLSKREVEILQGLKSGLTYEEIAETHFLSTHTVHTHIKKIYQKLHVNNRHDAVKKAVVFKLLTGRA